MWLCWLYDSSLPKVLCSSDISSATNLLLHRMELILNTLTFSLALPTKSALDLTSYYLTVNNTDESTRDTIWKINYDVTKRSVTRATARLKL